MQEITCRPRRQLHRQDRFSVKSHSKVDQLKNATFSFVNGLFSGHFRADEHTHKQTAHYDEFENSAHWIVVHEVSGGIVEFWDQLFEVGKTLLTVLPRFLHTAKTQKASAVYIFDGHRSRKQ